MPVPEPAYGDSSLPIRDDLAAVHRDAWARLALPGSWWTGARRLEIAAAARAARRCGLCQERKAAVSPNAVQGGHDGPATLPPRTLDAIHRIVTDPGRLSRSWLRGLLDADLPDTHYVELLGVTVTVTAIDLFARAIGVTPAPLPDPVSGEPSRIRPAAAREDGAWVPLVPAGEAGGDEARDLYGDVDHMPNIGRALSLVPAEVRGLLSISGAHYMTIDHVADPTYVTPGSALDRPQMELVAARVSALNDCFY